VKLIAAYGFSADVTLTPRHNASQRLVALPTFDYWNRPTKLAFHDLTTLLSPPPNLRSLLGLGLKFIPTPFQTTRFSHLQQAGTGLTYLERSLRIRCFFCAEGTPTSTDYNPKMQYPSDWDPPDEYFPNLLKNRLFQFSLHLHRLFKPRPTVPNLTKHHRNALEYLRSQTDFIVANCDKNLGPAIIERDKYVALAIRDHLSDATTYKRLLPDEAAAAIATNKSLLKDWLSAHSVELSVQEWGFVHYHSNSVLDPLPYFYLLMKIHKEPLKTRPIVSFSGSLFHALGVWVDTHLQVVAKTFASYLQSSFVLIKELKSLTLPPNCRLFTADATSMYTNINTDAAIKAIHDYIMRNQAKFPTLPLTPLIEALTLIMKRNVFQFGDTFWHQLMGTAMGAPPAPTYANISYGTHEDKLLPMFRHRLAYYKRYIDDVFGIWIPHPDPVQDERLWLRFQRRLNGWHGLQWITSPRCHQVVFLDLTISLQGTRLHHVLYDKPLNLHLYLPPRSAHPPGVLYGLIAGSIYRAKTLCSNPADAQDIIKKFWRQLRARGYPASTLRPLFEKALCRPPPPTAPVVTPETETTPLWFFKQTYHPQDPPSSAIRRAWQNTVADPPFSKPLKLVDFNHNPVGDRRFIVCYRRAPNLGNLLSYRKLQPDSGPPVSSFFE
jgi:hypothetical protein